MTRASWYFDLMKEERPSGTVARKKPGQPEFRLQVAIVDRLRLLALPGVFWTALPMGEKRGPKTAAKLKRMGVIAGCPDLLIIKEGLAIGIELKTERDDLRGTRRGYLSPEQKAIQIAWEGAGGKYILCQGFDAAINALTAQGIIRPDHSIRRPQVAA